MKKGLKIVGYILLSILSLIILILLSIKVFENKIADIAVKKVGESMDIPVEIDRVSLNLFRKFPLATVKLQGIWLGDPNSVEILNVQTKGFDSIAYIEKVYISVNTRKAIKGQYEIKKVELAGIDFTYTVDSSGVSNIDFLMPSDTSEVPEEETESDSTSILDALLNDLTLKNITLHYQDASMGAKAQIHIPEIKASGKALGDFYAGKLMGSIILSNCDFDPYPVELMQKTELAFDLEYVDNAATINKLNLKSDGIELDVLGNASLGDSIYVDLAVKLADINLGELIKYAPAEMLTEFGVKGIAGIINIDTKIKGYYFDSLVLPRVDAKVNFSEVKVLTKDYPPINSLNVEGSFTNGEKQNNSTTSANFSKIEIKMKSSSVNLAFQVKNIDQPEYRVKSNLHIDIAEFKNFIPDSTVEYINGKINLAFETYGTLPVETNEAADYFSKNAMNSADYFMDRTKINVHLDNINTALDSVNEVQNLNLNFAYTPRRVDISNVSLKAPGYGISLKNAGIKARILGQIKDMDHMGADIESFNFEVGNNRMKGKAFVQNLDEPSFKIETDIQLMLAELKPFIDDTLVKDISGKINFSLKSHGTINLDSIETQAIPIAFEQSEITLNIEDLKVVEALEDPLMTIDDFDFIFAMADDTIRINNFYVEAQGIDFRMDSTTISNVYKTILLEQADQQIIMHTNINVGAIDYAVIESFMPADSTQIEGDITTEEIAEVPVLYDTLGPQTLLPDFIELGIPHFLITGKMAIEQVKYGKNVLDEMSLFFRFSDSLYVVDQYKIKTCGGELNTSVMIDARRDWANPKVDFKNYISGLDVKQLIENNDYFGDTALAEANLTGILTSELHARAFLIGDSVPTNRIRAKGDFSLENGSVHNFEPLVKLSNSFGFLGGLKELDELDFNTMKTSIFFLNDKIYIPKTDVVSSALDISAFGMYNMNSDYEFHMKLHLGDVLTGKSDKLMAEQEKQNKKDGSNVERNGLNLIAKDLDGDSKYGFDNDKLKENMLKAVKRQNSMLNLLFNPALVNFSTDVDRTKFKTDQLKED